jgi:5'-nucleotidase
VQSATSHGITFHEPLMTRTVRASPTLTGIAVDGRPADCTKLALTELWPARFGGGARPDWSSAG